MDQGQGNEGAQQNGNEEDSQQNDNDGGQQNDNHGSQQNGDGGDQQNVKKPIKKRNRKTRACCNCKRGYYLAAADLRRGIEDAIASCPPNEQEKLRQLRLLQSLNDLRPRGGDLTRKTQAAILNDITERHERMPDDKIIVDLGDRCHNHLWYSALIRHNMVVPAEWQAKPHIAVRLKKLTAVWDQVTVRNTPNLRQRTARPQAAVNQPAGDDDEDDEHDDDDEHDEDNEHEDDKHDEDDDHGEVEDLQQSQSQVAHPTRVPRANQGQYSARMPPFGYTTNSMGQGYGQMHPDMAYGHQAPMHQQMFGRNPSQLGYMGQSSFHHSDHGHLDQHSQNRHVQFSNQQLLGFGMGFPTQQFVVPDLLPNNYGLFNNFASSHNQLPGAYNTNYGGFDASSFGSTGSGSYQAAASHQSQHRFPRMKDANRSIGLANPNHLKPMSFRDPFGQSNQTSLQSQPDVLDDSGGFARDDYYDMPTLFGPPASDDDASPQLIPGLAALSGTGMAHTSDTETGSGTNSGTSDDGTHNAEVATDAATPPSDDESHNDSIIGSPQSDGIH